MGLRITFPNATAVVAISNTKLSPSLAGAATHIGLVPSTSSLALVGTSKGEVFVNAIPFMQEKNRLKREKIVYCMSEIKALRDLSEAKV